MIYNNIDYYYRGFVNEESSIFNYFIQFVAFTACQSNANKETSKNEVSVNDSESKKTDEVTESKVETPKEEPKETIYEIAVGDNNW